MNRLVIVGNGFDLAHGLKTSYEDFLVDYIKELIKKGESDELTTVTINQLGYYDLMLHEILDFKDLQSLATNQHIDIEFEKKILPSSGVYFAGQERTVITTKVVTIRFKFEFLRMVYSNKNWTDIESFYFKSLLKLIKTDQLTEDDKKRHVIKLNQGFNLIKLELAKYLKKIELDIESIKRRNKILDVLDSSFMKIKSGSHISKMGIPVKDLKEPEKVFFLNFNYTSLLNNYIQLFHSDNRNNSTYLPIHGSIDDVNSIIFGYGDETHDDYKFLENQDEEELLKNIKSFYYPAKPYYQELMDFINAEDFDVYVIGHSLGLSDRVLLKTIFENDKCKAIKLFHRGTEQNQFRKRIALSRHFDDKIKMRNKILNFDEKDVFGGWESIEY